jgi:hypothetical protein
MKLSIMVTRRVKLAMELEGALAVNADEALVGLGEFFLPVLDDTPLDARTFLDGLRLKMAWWRGWLCDLDLAHQETVSERQSWRRRETVQAKSLYDRLVNMRRTTRGLLTEQDLLTLGLAGTVAQEPVKVLRQSEKTWKRFHKDDLKIESEEWPEVRAPLTALASRLEPDVEGLTKSVKEVRRARRKVWSAAARKRQAIKDFDRQYLWIAKTVEMLFRMAGLDEAADRVKPRSRRLERDVEGGGNSAVDGEDTVGLPLTGARA